MPETDMAACFARCFRGSDGARAIAYLRRMTLDIASGPEISDARLRHLEGQRFITSQIISLVERGQT